jgi:hypothetical protein
MVQIKGTIVKETVENIKNSFRKDEYDRFIHLLPEEGRKLFQDPISSSDWYNLDVFTSLLDTLVGERHKGDPKKLIKPTEKVVEKQLRGMYSVFVKKNSPEALLKKASVVTSTYLKGVDVKLSMVSEGNAQVKYIGFNKHHSMFGYYLIGFYRKALEVCGAKNINVEFITPIVSGKEYAELVLKWE